MDGRSTEHEVSCTSAGNILDKIDKRKYKITKIGIDKQGIWYQYLGSNQNVKTNRWLKDICNLKKVTNIIEFVKSFDVVFPVLHGKYGEDGTIQGMFDMFDIKYVGCNSNTSAICINKKLSKIIAKSCNIPIVDYMSLKKSEYEIYKKYNFENLNKKIIQSFGYPIIVKPNNGGSSVGTVKVKEFKNLENALTEAFKYDSQILIEKCIDAREIECAVLKQKNDYIVPDVGEIVPANEIYDYDAKYNSSKSICKIPAQIDDVDAQKIKQYAKTFAISIDVKGLSRIDFFVSKSTGKIYFNEINTMPGFTDISMYPKLIQNYGIECSKLIDLLIDMALDSD